MNWIFVFVCIATSLSFSINDISFCHTFCVIDGSIVIWADTHQAFLNCFVVRLCLYGNFCSIFWTRNRSFVSTYFKTQTSPWEASYIHPSIHSCLRRLVTDLFVADRTCHSAKYILSIYILPRFVNSLLFCWGFNGTYITSNAKGNK